MASTYLSLHYHIVFATRDREKFIDAEWRPRLHEYIGGILRGLDGQPQAVGGVADHVHILAGLRAVRPVADVVRELKRGSSVWVHEEIGLQRFGWQTGYSAFSVSPNARESVLRYIARQEEHHRIRSFQDELTEFLTKAGVEYDPRYLE